MERSLVWIALAAGCASWFIGLSLSYRKRFTLSGLAPAISPLFLAAAAGLPALVFLVTLPSHGKLFAGGHDLGNGFLIGALGSLLSSILLIQHLLADDGEKSHVRSATVTAAPFAMAVAAAAAILLVPTESHTIALLGVAIGWLAVTAILTLGLAGKRGADSSLQPEAVSMLAGACFSSLVCALVALGDLHGSVEFIKGTTYVTWGVLALATAAAVPLFTLLTAAADLIFNQDSDPRSAKPADPDRVAKGAVRARVCRAAIVIAGIAEFGRLLSNRVIYAQDQNPITHGKAAYVEVFLIGQSSLVRVLGAGIIIGMLIWWITAAAYDRESNRSDSDYGTWQNNLLPVLVLLAGAMSGFQMLYGYGLALVILGIWPSVALAVRSTYERGVSEDARKRSVEIAMRLVQFAAMGAGLALYRLYTTLYNDDFPKAAFTDQYALFGLVAGVALPLFLTNYLAPGSGRSNRSLLRLFAVGLVILAAPAFMLMLWGQKCIMAFLTAMALTSAGVLYGNPTERPAYSRLFPALFGIGTGLALCEWSHYLLDRTDWTRLQKERVVFQLVLAVIVILLAADFVPRVFERLREIRTAAGKTDSMGGAR